MCFAAFSVIPTMAHVSPDESDGGLLWFTQEENQVVSAVPDNTGRNIIEDEITTDIAAGNFQTIEVSEDTKNFLASMCYVPDDVLNGSTYSLFEYFMESDFLKQAISASNTVSDYSYLVEDYFTGNMAFAELLKRSDLLDAMEKYSLDMLQNNYTLFKSEVVSSLLSCPEIRNELLNSKRHAYPYLNYIMDGKATAGNVPVYPDYSWSYSEVDGVKTASNKNVDGVLVADGDWTNAEKSQIISFYNYNYSGLELLHNPTGKYNCHSFAWHSATSSNPYWIEGRGVPCYLADAKCSEVTSGVKENDIVVYYRTNNRTILHSAIIKEVRANGDHIVISKWGDGPAFRHAMNNVPPSYMSSLSSGVVNVKIYRYHNYSAYSYSGDQHSGDYHYVYSTSRCRICNDVRSKTQKYICSGNPCIIPYSRPGKDEVA